MKIRNALLASATLLISLVRNVAAVPPKGVEFIEGMTIMHPVFGELKVISHTRDIEYYNKKATDPDDASELIRKFTDYVVNTDSWKSEGDISKESIEARLHTMTYTRCGKNILKIIITNYMRAYDRIKQFCLNNKEVLKDYNDACEKSKHEKSIVCYDLKLKLRQQYTNCATKIQDAPCRLCVSKKQFTDLYTYFVTKEASKQDNADDVNNFPFEIEKAEYNLLKQFYTEQKDTLKMYSDMCKELGNTKKSKEISELKSLREELKEALDERYKNEMEFISIREKTVREETLPELYEHSEYISLKPEGILINTHLIRKLTFSSDDQKTRFIPDKMKINLQTLRMHENMYVSVDGSFLNCSEEKTKFEHNGKTVPGKYDALQHEIIHFMQEVVFSDYSKKEHKIEDVIKRSKNTSLQTFARYCDDMAPSGRLPHKIYDVTSDMLCMYGIIWDANEDAFYYDPINEAIADAECKIFDGKKQKLVRTGHGTIRNAEFLSKLNRDWNIYGFYFDEKLRELIP